MTEIVSSTTLVCDIMRKISVASEEQSQGISQIAVAVNQLDIMTQQNSALVEQSAAATCQMEQHARQLAAVVKIFQLSSGAPQTFCGEVPPV